MSSDLSDREGLKAEFLAAAGVADARRELLPADASTRRYERLHLADGGTLMLMDAPLVAETRPCDPAFTPEQRAAAGYNALARLAAGRIEAFAATAGYLRSRGLSAPQIVALDADQGLALTEDLGDGLFARLIEQGQDEAPMYMAAVEALVRLHEEEPPAVIEDGDLAWPLLDYDETALRTGADLFIEWLPRFDPRVTFSGEALAEWGEVWRPVISVASSVPSVFAHRDYHAENLLWLPDREGVARVGMLDFQDAVRAHPSWDLHSLLQDARRDVPASLEAAALARYFELRPQIDRQGFMADYAALAALNEARIIGIFARAIARDGKPRYRAFLPRMWRHLQANLAAQGLEAPKAWFDRYVPVEVRG